MQRIRKIESDLGAQQFSYTTSKGCLTLEQRRFYEQNGYIVLRSFLKDQDIQKWRARFLQYCDKKILPIEGMQIIRDISLAKKYKDSKLLGEENITKLQYFQDDKVLQTYCTNPDLIPYLKSFCGNNIKSVHTMFINKPPGMGTSSRHPFHQDLAYFPFRPINSIVAVWAALEDSTIQNGSLNIVPKSHKGKFYDHGYPEQGNVNKAYFGIKTDQKIEDKAVDLQMKKGDIVLFHPLLLHGSGENKSKGYRKSMCCHFAASQCQFISIEGTAQESVANQVMGYISKKFPYIKDYHSLWRSKSSLVCGKAFENKI